MNNGKKKIVCFHILLYQFKGLMDKIQANFG